MDDFLSTFTETTINVLRNDGLESFLPTIVVPSRANVMVIEGIPREERHTTALVNFVETNGLVDEELIFAVRSGPNIVVTGHYIPGAETQFIELALTNGEYRRQSPVSCDWWTVRSTRMPN